MTMAMIMESCNSSGIIDTALQGAAKGDDSNCSGGSIGKMIATAIAKRKQQ